MEEICTTKIGPISLFGAVVTHTDVVSDQKVERDLLCQTADCPKRQIRIDLSPADHLIIHATSCSSSSNIGTTFSIVVIGVDPNTFRECQPVQQIEGEGGVGNKSVHITAVAVVIGEPQWVVE